MQQQQQYQVGRRNPSQPPQQSLKYNQYQTRSPFASIENTQNSKTFHHKASTDIDAKPAQPTQNPYYNQFLKRSSNSSHQEKPPSLQYSNSKQSLNPNQSHDYSIQFKVGKNERRTDQTNETQLSQFLNPTKFTCMSPGQNRENSIIYQSPKHDSRQQPMLQSPPPYNLINTPQYINKVGSQSHIKPYPNTVVLSQELKQIQESNAALQQKVNSMESEINRGQSSQFISELEQKIHLLKQLNVKLQSENQQLMHQLDVPKMHQTLENQQTNRRKYSQQLQTLRQETSHYTKQCQDLKEKIDSTDDSQIKELVNELENKVQNLISENDSLNLKLQSGNNLHLISDISKCKNEVDQLNKQYQSLKREEEHLKQNFSQLEQVYDQKVADNLFADLYEKIELLVEENERLQQVINDAEFTDQDLNELKERIKVVKQDNSKMEQRLKRKTKNH